MFHYKPLVVGMILISAAGLTGCSQNNKDTGTTVKMDASAVEDSKKQAQAQMDEIKNNPKIPEEQKQAILSRMQSMQGQQSGEASVLSKQGNSGAPAK